MRTPKYNIALGQRFGRWVTILVVPSVKGSGTSWLCRCDCGTERHVRQQELGAGNSISCGCYQKEAAAAANRTHNSYQTREYKIWQGMKTRCLNPRHRSYFRYGGRGITVCNRWLESFENFLADMGSASRQQTLDRINNDGNYEPDNCRWATKEVQDNNKPNSQRFTFQGETLTVAQWARRRGINERTLHNRLVTFGWPVDVALSGSSLSRRGQDGRFLPAKN